MGGGTLERNAILFNLVSELNPVLRGRTCKLYGQDLRLWIEAYQLFTYPDLLLICGAPRTMTLETSSSSTAPSRPFRSI